MVNVPVLGFRKYWPQNPASLKSECHVITNKSPEAPFVVQQAYKELGDIENLAGYTPANVEESSELTSVENSAKKNRANYCKNSSEGSQFLGLLTACTR
jgi:hypothetical protein